MCTMKQTKGWRRGGRLFESVWIVKCRKGGRLNGGMIGVW